MEPPGRRRRPRRPTPPPLLGLGLGLGLLLVGAEAAGAGLDFSGLQESPSQGPSTARMPKRPFLGHLRPPGSTQQGPSLRLGVMAVTAAVMAALPTHLALPRLATPSASPHREIRPGMATPLSPTEATNTEPSQALGTTMRRTPFPARRAGMVEGTEVPGISGGNKQHHLPPPPVPNKFMTLLPMLALLPMSVSPKDAVGPASIPSPLSKGDPNSGVGEGASGGWPPAGVSLSSLPGSGVSAVEQPSWTEMGPGKGGLVGAMATWGERSSAVTAEGSQDPPTEPPWDGRRPCSPTAQEARGPPTETGGTLPLSTWWPVTDAAEPGLAWLPTSGQGREAATIAAELAPLPTPIQSSGLVVMGDEGLPEELGVNEASVPGPLPQSGPSEPWTAVGPFRQGTAMPPSSTLPRSSKGLGRSVAMAEIVLQDHSVGSPVASSAPSIRASLQETRQETPAEAPSSSTASPAGRKGEETQSSSSSSSSGTTSSPPLWVGSSSNSPWTAGPRSLLLPTGLDWLSPDSPRGASWHSRGETDPSESGPGPLAFSDTALIPAEVLPEGSSATLGEEGGPLPDPSEPFSTSSTNGRELVQLTSRPTQLPPSWLAKGVPFVATVPHLTEASTSPGTPVASTKSPRGFLSPPAKQAAKEGAPRWAGEGAWAGTATEMAETPTSRTSGRVGKGVSQTGTPAEWLAGSPAGSPTAKEAVLSPSPSQDPGLLPKMASVSSPAPESVAVPTTERGATKVPDDLSATQQPWTSSAGTRSWEWGLHSSGPVKEVTLWPHHLGTLHTASAGPPGRTRHTRPPMPASDPREGLPVASTWLLASAPEEAEGATTAMTSPAPAVPREGPPRAHPLFIAENQPPRLKATLLHIPCELVLAMEFSRNFQNPESPEYRSLVLSINETVTPLLASLPGFQRLEVKTIRPGSVVVEFDALFLAKAPGLWSALNRSSLSERLPPGLWVANTSVLRSMTQERHLDLCAVLFSCHAGYECVAEESVGSAICISLCHRDYCKNQGICTHVANHTPVCQCPVGRDFWFLGVRCDYKVTQQGILGVACGLLLSLVVVGVAVAGLVIRRVRLLLLEARADQTKSSYRRFCRLDDVSAHYWSEPWLASASSLDNPAFSNSEELLHLQILDTGCYGCQEESLAPDSYCKQLHQTPHVGAVGQPSSRYHWDESSNSANDPMIDSGKASEVSVSSWPMEPIQWSPFPGLHKPPREQVQKAVQRPLSCCEGMELVSLERSWTA